MSTGTAGIAGGAAWFVGAAFGGTDDQTLRFVSDGIWETHYNDKYSDLVRSMQPGERIAIKSSYTRRNDLPFDNRGIHVSVMAIKAIGTITENLNDGRRIRVDWVPVNPAREWYFFTSQKIVWKVFSSSWAREALVSFTFGNDPQDLELFLNYHYWRNIYRRPPPSGFEWTEFYEAVAEQLLGYRNNRTPLIEGIHEIASRVPGLSYLEDRYGDQTRGPLRDICPFTAMGIFNRWVTDANRQTIATELARFLGVKVSVPQSFDGVPLLNNQRSWFFSYADKRSAGDIDALWAVFAAARQAIYGDQSEVDAFVDAYDAASKVRGVAWNLSMGLFWAHPWHYVTLDSPSRQYIRTHLRQTIGTNGDQGVINGERYWELVSELRERLLDPECPVKSFPELSREASKDPNPDVTYSVDDIVADGCFLDRPDIEHALERLRTKKNLILQGPPGTGKTWLAKRLACALVGQKTSRNVRVVQFHPNLTYEDFVRGWRPTGSGTLSLVDGIFLETMKAASDDPSSAFVVVIEEINRGNPTQIFGELLTLLEADKRTPDEALELCYPDPNGKNVPVYIPENLYVIGTMNIADRSLALVDLALRRRFAFVGLEPRLGPVWRDWVTEHCGIDRSLVNKIQQRISALNERIAADSRLGKQFRIGHSYVTPARQLHAGETTKWFRDVVETEIGPLLDEYWFDAPAEAEKATSQLLTDWP
jgi:5-methylcytosine-specific restriction protein B